MSGLEVVGAIASIIGIIDGSAKVWAGARKDLKISDTFQAVATRLPLLQDTLRTCNDLLEPEKDTLPKDAADALLKTVKSCENKAAKLHKIFQETIPGEGEEWYSRYRKVANRLGKGTKVEDLMKSIAEDAQTVAHYHLVRAARPDLGDKLDTVIKQMETLEPSLPNDDEPGNVFNAFGGTMHNNLNYGGGPQNTGSGDMYNISGLSGNPVFHLGPTIVTTPKFSGLYSHSSSRAVQKYVSRPELEDKLQAQLIGCKDNSRERRTVVVWGLGGSGKSQLTLNYVQKHREAYGPIFWIDARVKETIERDFTHIHKLLRPDLNTSSATVEDAIAAVKNWLSTEERRSEKRRALWIMDSADAIEGGEEAASHIDIQYYLPDALNLDIIITTRSSRARYISSHDSVEVEKMTETEAKLLFVKNANLPHECGEIEQEISEIVKELGCLALAVALAGSYVSETKIRVQEYLPRYRADRSRILALKPHKLEHQYAEGVLSTWEMSFAALQRQSPIGAQLLTLLAFINPNDIFLGLFEDELNHTNDPENLDQPRWLDLLSPGGAGIDIFVIESAFAAIHAYSFITWQVDQRAYVMHNMVHAWGHDRLEVSQRQYWSLATLELLIQVTGRNIYNPRIATRTVPHMVAAFTAISKVCGSNYLMADRDRMLLLELSFNLCELGQFTHMHDVCVYLVQATELVHGRKHPETLIAIFNLAIALSSIRDYVQTEKLFRGLLESYKELFGSKHPNTLRTMTGLGSCLLCQDKCELAEETLQSALELQQKELSFDDPVTLRTMVALSVTLAKQGKLRQAEEMQRHVLESQKQLLGPEATDTLQSMYSLACTLESLEDFEEAEQMFRQTLVLQEKVLGPVHPSSLHSRSLLARLVGTKGEYEQAKAMLQETIAFQQQVLGLEHHDVLVSLNSLAIVLNLQGEYNEAEQIWQSMVEPGKRTLGSEHRTTQAVLGNLAGLRERKNKNLEADLRDADGLQQELVDTQDSSQETEQLLPRRSTRSWKRILSLGLKR